MASVLYSPLSRPGEASFSCSRVLRAEGCSMNSRVHAVEENRVLKEQMKGRKLRLNGDQRLRLPAKGKRLGKHALDGVATIVTQYTIMHWHRKLIAQKWTHQTKRGGRPGLMKKIAALIVRMAT